MPLVSHATLYRAQNKLATGLFQMISVECYECEMFHASCHHKIKFSRANRRLAILLRELHALELPSLIREKRLLISGNNLSTDVISSARPIAFASRLLLRCCSTFREHAIDFRIFLTSTKTSNVGDRGTPLFSILPSPGRSDYFSGLPRLCSACRLTSEVATSIS